MTRHPAGLCAHHATRLERGRWACSTPAGPRCPSSIQTICGPDAGLPGASQDGCLPAVNRRYISRGICPTAAGCSLTVPMQVRPLGTKGFFLNGVDDVSVMALFFFMMVFMDTTATIPTGAMAERWSVEELLLCTDSWVALALLHLRATGCGAAAGWRRRASNWGLGHGAVDFAGSGVVHCDGRRHRALAGAIVIGPRIGKYAERQAAARSPATTSRWCMLGTFILAFGWFGFNPGSTLAGTDCRIGIVVVNTMLAGIAGRAWRRCSTCGSAAEARSRR